jgi:hypothetical protein
LACGRAARPKVSKASTSAQPKTAAADVPPAARPKVSSFAREIARQALYTLSPSAWCRRELKLLLDPWQVRMVDAPAASRVICLTHRQAGKTTGAAIGVAHTMLWRLPGSTSLVLAPTQRQSSELVRNLRSRLLTAGERLTVDNTFSIELSNGSRVLAMPGNDDASIRGLSIGGDCLVDEAARVPDELYEAARPMLIRHVRTARLLLLSTAWARDGFFYKIWSEGDPRDWMKIEATVGECQHISKADLDVERRSMPASAFAREYENEFGSEDNRFFSPEALAAWRSGGVSGPTPPISDADSDPIVSSTPMFARRFG